MHLLGIDIGGTKTSVCVGTDAGEIIASERISSAGHETTDHYGLELASLCQRVIAKSGIAIGDMAAVGISAPGPLSVKRGVLLAPPNLPGWHELPIVQMVRAITGRPVFINNDANAAALAEFVFGAHRGTPDMLYLTFSTGMGGGIISGGRLVQGINDMGGEVGHHVVDIDGPACPCGRRGCWEMYVGGRNVALQLQARIRRENLKTAILDKAGGDIDKISMKHLEAAVREGDPLAVAEWEQLTERLAQGIGTLIMVLNPQVVLLGTIAIHAGELVMAPLQKKLPKYAWPWPLGACTVTTATLGKHIGDYAALAVASTGLQSASGR